MTCEHNWKYIKTVQYQMPKEKHSEESGLFGRKVWRTRTDGYYFSRHDYFYCAKCLADHRKDQRESGWEAPEFFRPWVETEWLTSTGWDSSYSFDYRDLVLE